MDYMYTWLRAIIFFELKLPACFRTLERLAGFHIIRIREYSTEYGYEFEYSVQLHRERKNTHCAVLMSYMIRSEEHAQRWRRRCRRSGEITILFATNLAALSSTDCWRSS